MLIELERNGDSLRGLWTGPYSPQKGDSFYIELNVNTVLPGRLYEENTDMSLGASVAADHNEIRVLVESVEEDGVHFLRLSPDLIIMAEFRRTFLEVGKFYRISIPIMQTSIYAC